MHNIFHSIKTIRNFFILPAFTFFLSCNTGENTTWKKDSIAKINNAKGWERLLKGGVEDWHTYGGKPVGAAWKMEDSVLHLDASVTDNGQTIGGGDIVSRKEYENFDLKLDWKISEGGNSGILFYVSEDTQQFKIAGNSGLEMQITDNATTENGKILKHKTGDLYDLISSKAEQVVYPAGDWNYAEIIANKGKLDFYLNNDHILSVYLWDDKWKSLIGISSFSTITGFGSFTKGRIALQDNGADVWFKNVRIKKL